MALVFSPQQTVLMIGDSITDGCRTREDPDHLGLTYAAIAAGLVQNLHPELRLKFYNRGIAGDSVRELRARWQEDCLDLNPDWVSISVGANDVNRRFKEGANPVELPEYEETYRSLLDDCRTHNPEVRFILMEPSCVEQDNRPGKAVPCTASESRHALMSYVEVVRELADVYGALLVPIRKMWNQTLQTWPEYQWTNDGVHTSCEGSVAMALCWVKAVGMTVGETR